MLRFSPPNALAKTTPVLTRSISLLSPSKPASSIASAETATAHCWQISIWGRVPGGCLHLRQSNSYPSTRAPIFEYVRPSSTSPGPPCFQKWLEGPGQRPSGICLMLTLASMMFCQNCSAFSASGIIAASPITAIGSKGPCSTPSHSFPSAVVRVIEMHLSYP